MPDKNKYYRHSKISEAKFRHLLRLLAMDLTASDAAQLCGFVAFPSIETVLKENFWQSMKMTEGEF